MKTPARAVAVLGGAALAVGGRQPALAAEGDAAIRIEFVAPAGCPDAAEFVRAIEGRTSNLRHAAEGEKARLVRGEIEARTGGVLGRLVLVETDGRTSERTLEAGDCRQATDALALIAALAIDRRAAETSAPAASSLRSTPPPSLAPSGRPAPPPAPPTPPSSASGASSPPPLPPRKTESSAARRLPISFQGTAAAFGALGMAPEPTGGGALLVAVLFDAPRPPWSWSVGVGLAATLDRSFDELGGAATFSLLTGLAEVCPLALHLGAGAWVRPCVEGEYGVVRARASHTSGAGSVDRPWGGAGLGARLGYDVVGPLWIGATIEGLVALQRNAFEFGDSRFFESPAVVGRALVGVSAVLP